MGNKKQEFLSQCSFYPLFPTSAILITPPHIPKQQQKNLAVLGSQRESVSESGSFLNSTKTVRSGCLQETIYQIWQLREAIKENDDFFSQVKGLALEWLEHEWMETIQQLPVYRVGTTALNQESFPSIINEPLDGDSNGLSPPCQVTCIP